MINRVNVFFNDVLDERVVMVEAVAEFYWEEFGADADGNRGEYRWFFDEFMVFNVLHNGVDIKNEIDEDDLDKIMEAAVEKASEKL